MSKVDGKFKFSPVSVNFLTEATKVVFAIKMLLIQTRHQKIKEKPLLSISTFVQLHDLIASSSSAPSTRDCIMLGACEAHETFPQSAEFPSDIFTSCLSTPLKMALRW